MDLPTPTIRDEVRRNGGISFARFMELALYKPGVGYYERAPDRVGKGGDYYTSVSVGSFFGQLLAARFVAWLTEDEAEQRIETRQGPPRRIVEAGAYDGRLARDILTWMRAERPEAFAHINYCILEPSRSCRTWQQDTLAEFRAHVQWATNWQELGEVRGVFFSNELLDAMPVHRLVWSRRAQEWREATVVEAGEKLGWSTTHLRQLSEGGEHLAQLPKELKEKLPDRFATEVSPAATEWWRQAAKAMKTGRLVTIDYGLEAGEFLHPARAHGTVRAYCRHRVADDVLSRPGEQDLTAQVNFTAIRTAGERLGLTTEEMLSQGQFLSRIALELWPGKMDSSWTPAYIRQFQTLIHPQHLGHTFRVLVQRRKS